MTPLLVHLPYRFLGVGSKTETVAENEQTSNRMDLLYYIIAVLKCIFPFLSRQWQVIADALLSELQQHLLINLLKWAKPPHQLAAVCI